MRCSNTLVILWSGRSIGGLCRLWPLIISWLLLMCYWLPLHSPVHPEGENMMKTKVELIITLTASVALFFPFFLFMSHPINHIVEIRLFVRVWVLWDAALSTKTKQKALQRTVCTFTSVFFLFVCPIGKKLSFSAVPDWVSHWVSHWVPHWH